MRRAAAALALLFSLIGPVFAQATVTLRLTFIGDIMAHEVNYRMASYDDIYSGVADMFRGDDLTFANLELPVDPTRPDSGYPFFNGSPAYVKAAVDAGIDVFSLANNHAFDGGEEGIFQTLRSLAGLRDTSRPFLASGIRGNPRQPFRPAVMVVKGVRVGFFALSQFLNVPGGGRYVHVVDYGDEATVAELLDQVRDARARVDLLVVSWHGDAEYVQEPAPGKRLFFHRLLDAGAQVVFSHHPHVVQGYEIVPGSSGTGLIMYSMGNFISGMTWGLDPSAPDPPLAATGEAYVLQVSVRCGADGCAVQEARPVPVTDYRSSRGEMVVARLEDLADGTIDLGAAWKRYYAGRLKMMEGFLARETR